MSIKSDQLDFEKIISKLDVGAMDISFDDYTIKNDAYLFNTSGKGGTISIKASVNIGDLNIKR
ncbi:MAG: hypothetical protein IBX70_08250 [Clostridia bacterium]|nr:hypothetical protein [Clostridia bacterium]